MHFVAAWNFGTEQHQRAKDDYRQWASRLWLHRCHLAPFLLLILFWHQSQHISQKETSFRLFFSACWENKRDYCSVILDLENAPRLSPCLPSSAHAPVCTVCPVPIERKDLSCTPSCWRLLQHVDKDRTRQTERQNAWGGRQKYGLMVALAVWLTSCRSTQKVPIGLRPWRESAQLGRPANAM